jgi:hypothetical protein
VIIRDNAHAPTLGIQDLLDGTGTMGVAIKDEDPHLPWSDGGTGTHKDQYRSWPGREIWDSIP